MSPARFDHRDPGTSEEHWGGAGFGDVARVAPDRWRRLVVLAAHPDDETLGAGGLIHRAAAAGADVTVLVATNGEHSHPLSPTHDPVTLTAIRRQEVRTAVSDLAPRAHLEFLDLPDGALAGHRSELHRALARRVGPDVLLVAPWRTDGHADHDAAGFVAAAVTESAGATLWEYPIWAWHWGNPDDPGIFGDRLRRIDLTDAEVRIKERALDRHVSQHSPLSDRPGDEAMIGAEFRAHFQRPYELVLVGDPR